MLGVSFENPNFTPSQNGNHYVEPLLESFIAPRGSEQLFIYYSGLKYHNITLKLKYLSQDEINVFLWSVDEFLPAYLSYKQGNFSEYECTSKDFDGAESRLHITLGKNSLFKLTITNSAAYHIVLSHERFLYLMERIYLACLQYFFAKCKLNTLSENENTIVTGFSLPVVKYIQYADHIIFKRQRGDKVFFLKDNFSATTNSFCIGKLKLIVNDLDIYIPIEQALCIAYDIKTGKYFKLVERGQRELFSYTGGTFPKNSDEKPISRQFFILGHATDSNKLVLKANVGVGKISSSGGIIMDAIEKTAEITLSQSEALHFSQRLETFYFSFLIEQYLRDSKQPPEKQILSQLTKVNAKSTCMTTVARAFNMKKIRFDFMHYDTSNKQDKYIDFYFTEEDFHVLYNKLLGGSISKEISKEKKRMIAQGDKWGKSIYSKTCGTAGETAGRSDSLPKAKIFNILPSSANDFALACYQGRGKVDDKGLIIMEKIEDRITIPISSNTLKAVLLCTMLNWKAYKIAQSFALESKTISK